MANGLVRVHESTGHWAVNYHCSIHHYKLNEAQTLWIYGNNMKGQRCSLMMPDVKVANFERSKASFAALHKPPLSTTMLEEALIRHRLTNAATLNYKFLHFSVALVAFRVN